MTRVVSPQRALRYFIFRCLPFIIFLVIIFSENLRWWAVGSMVIYIISLIAYGKDYEGHETILGIRKDFNKKS